MKTKKPHEKKILEGILKKHSDGFGFVIPNDKEHPDIYIPANLINSAFTNDSVTVSIQTRKDKPDKFFGAIESVVKRHKEFAIGLFEIIDGNEVVQNHNLSCEEHINVQNPNSITIKKKDHIKLKITQYPDEDNELTGEVVKNLGPITSSAKDDMKRVLSELDIALEFSEETLEDLNQIPDTVKEDDFSDRKDLRDKDFVTIDGETAKDFDDAIYVEKQDFGFRLFIAIADVSYYVKEGSNLDKEAFARGNSTYLPNFCVPMLPEKLSNDLCSLNPLQPRLVMVIELDYSPEGEILTSSIYPSVIISKKRLTYKEVQNMIDGTSDFGDLEFLKSAQNLAEILMKKHYTEGALNLEIEDTNIVVNELGEPTEFVKEEKLFTHQLIEQFMLAANKAVSAYLEKNNVPLMYRIHEDPKSDKLQHLQTFSKTLGHEEELNSRKNIISFLSKFKDHEKSPIINKLVLRSLSQARYSGYNKGHYGLNFKSYTHFTSPIRRYCDLMIHRLIKDAINKSQPLLDEKEIEAKGVSISGKEQVSVKAERQVKDIKKARFLSLHLGKNFTGVISSITPFGIFISLQDFDIEGLIRLRDMPGHWLIDDVNLSLTAKKSGYTMNFGDEVEIQVAATNPMIGNIDFQLISHKGKTLPEEKSFRRNSTRGRSSGGDRPYRSRESSGGDRPYRSRGPSSGGDRPYRSRESSGGDRPYRSRESSGGDRPYRSRESSGGDRPYRSRESSGGDRPYRSRESSGGDRPYRSRESSGGDRPYRSRESSGGDRPFRSRESSGGDRPFRSRESSGGDRPYRSRESSGGDRPYRSRESSGGDRPFRSRGPSSGGDRPYRSRESSGGDRPFRSRESSGGDRPFRSRESSGGDRPFRSRESSGGDRPYRSRGASSGGDRPYRSRGASSGGDRPFRSRGASSGGDRPFRSRESSGGDRPFRSRESSGGDRPFRSRESSGGESTPYKTRTSSDGTVRPYRPKGTPSEGDKPYRSRESSGGDKPYRSRESSGGDRPYRSRGPSSGGDRPFRSRGASSGGESRPYRSRESSGGDRPFRSRGPSSGGESRPYRSRESSGGDRPFRSRGASSGGESRPYRSRESSGGDRPFRSRGASSGGESRPYRSRGPSSDKKRY